MLVSAACRALMVAPAALPAAAALLPAATPALVTAASRLAGRLHPPVAPFSFSSAAGKPAKGSPDTGSQQREPQGETLVAKHPGLAREQAGAGAAPDQALVAAPPAGGKLAGSYMLMHPVYSKEYVESVTPAHKPPKKVHEKLGYLSVQALRKVFDAATGYGGDMNERKWLARFLYLETVAGVPGMVAGMLRHLRSLRLMRRDNGWIHTLLEEAENERMHLLTFMQLRQPGVLFRAAVLVGQGVFFNAFLLAYLVSPKTCHAFVGYLEEEATRTYTRAIADLDAGKLPQWSHLEAPAIAKSYWRLAPDATMRDLLLAVRADEKCHEHVNHTLSSIDRDAPNPFQPGSVHVP